MRYAEEVLGAEEFDLPSMREAKVSDKEVQLAERLVADMTEDWDPRQYRDSYRDDLMKRIKALATKGRTHLVKTPAEGESEGGAQIIDLMAALKRSLDNKGAKSSRRAAANDDAKPARGTKRAAVAKSRATRSVKTAARKRA